MALERLTLSQTIPGFYLSADQVPYSPTFLKNMLCFFFPPRFANLKVTQLLKLCYIQMLLKIEKSVEYNKKIVLKNDW